ncbi:AraC family transcriptional regulator [Neoroseomonas soli]|uniref:AraC family transcriptional regulator n=1 Tax=Neoroseomonas soli TaxID=1081025 RepID=A0A9X9WZ38_9PROT|nr:AraC family transcriptional regulator [Neoroseomonas soli]MBR0672417.1 AraC family transcriptional regulator [Neoroseomonas soli]
MMHGPEAADAEGAVRRFYEPDDFSAALVGGSFEFMPMLGHRFGATLRLLRLGELVVQIGENRSHVCRGAMGGGMAALILPLHYGQENARMNGTEIVGSEAFLAPHGAEFFGQCPGPNTWAALAVPESQLEAWAELAPPPVRVRGEASVLALPSGPAAQLARVMATAARMAADLPDVLAAPGCAEGLALSLGEMVADALTSGVLVLPRPRAAREAQRIVAAADDFLRSALPRPVYREQLCAALAVSLRKLHDAFVATTGMSPQSYLKVRRLMLARRALRAAGDRPTQVKAVALSHGFWHFGHFARDYRALFGELPSQTVAVGAGA